MRDISEPDRAFKLRCNGRVGEVPRQQSWAFECPALVEFADERKVLEQVRQAGGKNALVPPQIGAALGINALVGLRASF